MSKKTLYLHIGTNKTGTTAIQDYLLRHRESLQAHSILFPLSGCTRMGNHSPLARDLQESLLQGRPAYKWENLLKEIRASQASRIVLSGEMFYALNKDGFRRLVSDLKACFSDIYVLCYIRRQDDYLRACYTQGVKMGRIGESFSEYRAGIIQRKKLKAYRYARSLKKWAKAFGEDRVIVRPFEAGQFYRNDVVADFCHYSQMPAALCPETPSKQLNPSPSRKTVQAMRLVRG
ncbi:MAG: hypothetical protein EP312_00455 [Gammaproteobacteria bacterium]|nr:MAG: hypothetical protein EP312_00455 [Gammaproteobacteria bacterium]